MQGGKKLFDQLDRAIYLPDKLLIVLSPSKLGSNWVQTEINRARKHELKTGKRKLFPIRLCNMQVLKSWACFDANSGRDLAEEVGKTLFQTSPSERSQKRSRRNLGIFTPLCVAKACRCENKTENPVWLMRRMS